MSEEVNNLVFKIDGLSHLLPGTPIAFSDRLKKEDDLISAQLDNVISAAIIIYLYQNGFQGTAFFTAQEEAGKSWRYVYVAASAPVPAVGARFTGISGPGTSTLSRIASATLSRSASW